jgi:hypothetical protein
LDRLAGALEISPTVLAEALNTTQEVFAKCERQKAEEYRLERERIDTEWRAAFRPHAVLQTTLTVPTQITICGLTGGPSRWLMIRLDDSKPPITFIPQALQALPAMIRPTSKHPFRVPFFGHAVGLIINYDPDRAIRCDLNGTPLEVLTAAYRIGQISASIGRKRLPPEGLNLFAQRKS